MTELALIKGGVALGLLFLWLGSAIAGGYLASRKGYDERYGLGSGLLLSAVGPIIWLFVPARPNSDWKRFGPFGSTMKT